MRAAGTLLAGFAGLASCACLTHPALAGSAPPAFGFNWATIGAPGNRPTLPQEVPFNDTLRIGAVPYVYRIATTEITGGQWLEFVQAYAPYVDPAYASSSEFTSGAIQRLGGGYSMLPQYTNRPVEMGWRFAARYANWLTNNKATSRDAFETGAYDTSTFHTNPDGTVTDQPSRSPGATFWIPSLDELIKAAYYDPNKNGPGQDGYWLQPGGQDEPLVSGPPGSPGAQTSAGVVCPGCYYNVGAYPFVSAPWGLLDISGGTANWTETFTLAAGGSLERYVKGAVTGQGDLYWIGDRLDWPSSTRPYGGRIGLRLASAIPSPGACALAGIGLSCVLLRRRQ